jgi:2-hydroxy-6-oxonona-2,4-dienedioate hydrolase
VILPSKSTTRKQLSSRIDMDGIVDLGSGPQTILFLHGLFGTPEHWRDVMEHLAKSYRVVAPQLPIDPRPGRRADGIQGISDLSDLVEELVEELDIERPVLCGNSLGGLVSIDLCSRNQGFSRGLVLAGSAGLFERSPIKGLSSHPSREFVRTTVRGIVHDKNLVTDELVTHWHNSITDRDYVRFVLRVSRATRDRTVEDELANLNLPTLIIWGRNDSITPPSTGEEFQRRIRGSQIEFINDCGHAPNWEQPEAFARLLEGFLPNCFGG